MAKPKKIKIGDALVEGKLITEEQLEIGLSVQKEKGNKIGNVLIYLGFITENDLYTTLSKQLNMEFVDLEHYNINKDVVNKLPERIARRFRCLVLDFKESQYVVAMSDPTDIVGYDEIVKYLGSDIIISIVKEELILKTIDTVYRRTEDIASFAEELQEELGVEDFIDLEQGVSEDSAPVIKLLDSIFEDAIQVSASDVHIEPDVNKFRIRQRVDGLLQESILNGTSIVSALVLRIKLMAKLNISEKRLPQDGRFRIRVKNIDLDVRVSTMPVRHGESVVMRILDQSKGILSCEELGLLPEDIKTFRFNINRPHGIILVTGPTGSGKTTTLYAALSELNVENKKIITIEDPVEYTLSRVNQVQVNTKIDLTFAKVLRTALRQDPDIIMVGEIRDEETAQIALRAAMTGHLVISTLHTNSAINSALRLTDMGAASYLVANAVRLIMAQRLIRKNCVACVSGYTLSKDDEDLLSVITGGNIDPNWIFHKGKGCSRCHNTGYAGRIAVHELLEIDSILADFLRVGDSKGFSHAASKKKNFKYLAFRALEKAIEGVTSLEEVFRLLTESENITGVNK